MYSYDRRRTAVLKAEPLKLKLDKGEATYDTDHEPGMRVPKGGSSCATCKFLSSDRKHCSEKHFQKWRESLGAEDPSALPYPADEYCTDWYEPKPGALG